MHGDDGIAFLPQVAMQLAIQFDRNFAKVIISGTLPTGEGSPSLLLFPYLGVRARWVNVSQTAQV